MCGSSDQEAMTLSNIDCHKLTQAVLKSLVGCTIFHNLHAHMFDDTTHSNHVILLTKSIVEKFLQVRYHYASKKYTMQLRQNLKCKSRQALSKLIIFFMDNKISNEGMHRL